MAEISISNYGNYSSNNYGANTLSVSINSVGTFYFSYSTCVAFRARGDLVISENVWGVTTGKHLNWINPDHKKRIPYEEFEKRLADLEIKLPDINI